MPIHADARITDARRVFVASWCVLLLAKAVLATRLPLFVDEAFYWQEGRHLSWAYSDLPGLTAWLIRLGTTLGGDHLLAVRAPFLLIAAWVPWIVVRIAMREGDARLAWQAGTFALVLPLLGSLGALALPDAPMALATVLCVDAAARMFRGVSHEAALQLAFGLAIGALSHYRFIAVIGVGGLVLLALPQGRVVLRDARTWIALAFGAAAWAPLLAWNLDNAEAGLRFQLVDRHPWALHGDGVWFVAQQALLVTPLLFAAMAIAAWRSRGDGVATRRLLAALGGLVVLGFFALGFFADTERVSFHWPLPGYLALLPLVPAVVAGWPRLLRVATWLLAIAGLVAGLAYVVAVSTPSTRALAAGTKWYPSNFAGWETLAAEVEARLATLPDDTVLVADNFKIGAELGFALGRPDIRVLAHPLNVFHGRAPQLRLWNLETVRHAELEGRPALLVIGATDVKFSALVAHYQDLCARFGALPPPHAVNVDHGSQRFLLVALPRRDAPAPGCTTPVVAHLDAPLPGARVDGTSLRVEGWAIKDGVGVSRVHVTVDGERVADAGYGIPNGFVQTFFEGRSTDPRHPDVGLRADIDLQSLAPGRHWLGLEIEGVDGSVETWAEQPFEVVR